jgi:hypothetical protein
MIFKSLLNKFNILFPKSVTFTDEDAKDLQKRIVGRYAQGNLSLHRGKYITSIDLELLKKKITSHNFT